MTVWNNEHRLDATSKVGVRGLAVLALVAALLALTLTSSLAQTPTTVRVQDTEIEADSSGSVPISLEGSPGIVAMHLEVTYDPDVLEWEGLEQGTLLAGNALLESNAQEPGLVIVGFATLEGASGDGELVVASFKSTGEEQSTTVSLENVQAWDSNGFDVLIETQDGEISIDPGFPLWLILLILAILALLFLIVLGLIIWLLRRRSKRSEPAVESASAPVAPVPPAATPQTPSPQLDGEQATQPRFCSSCGQPLQPGAAFCSNCGTQVPGN